ncbi:helix-turn-helix transcriptional regulator [Amycolatopsis sp.]|uniref:helix-turn-helix domain-containing protein n=1 Tax=Amycolatopsis sp. TaxID=37632 RepID=UPI00261554FD|nr:helix-turn-helix transcriptional regulator [Amycolatopsis sp.]
MLSKRRLGRRIKKLRISARMSLDEAAEKLDKTRSSLSRIENGLTRADVHLVRSMMDVYDCRDDWLIELARRASRKGWWLTFGITDKGYIGMETEAADALTWQLAYIPGLLQTEAYMRELFSTGPRWSKEQFENHVKARMFRQERLVDPDQPLRLTAIVDESVLTRPIGGAEVMRAQLNRLVEFGGLATVSLQVLPHGPKPHSGMDGAFTILRFEEAEDPDLLYLEPVTGSIHSEEPEEVRAARLVFDRLRSEALSPDESVAFIGRMAAQL